MADAGRWKDRPSVREASARDQLWLQLTRDEGTGPMKHGRMLPYRNAAGMLTIGHGRDLDGNGISLAEGHVMLDHDIDDVIKNLVAHYPWFEVLDPARQAVLVNMCVHPGIQRLHGFPDMLVALRRNDYDSAAVGILQSVWAEQVGARARRLAQQMRSGVWT